MSLLCNMLFIYVHYLCMKVDRQWASTNYYKQFKFEKFSTDSELALSVQRSPDLDHYFSLDHFSEWRALTALFNIHKIDKI